MALEEEFRFEIPDNEADKINAINLAVDFIASHPQAKQTKATHAFTQVSLISTRNQILLDFPYLSHFIFVVCLSKSYSNSI